MEQKTWKDRISYGCYRIIRWLVWLFYPKMKLEGVENLPSEPCLLVANHCKMNGPITAELYVPGERAIWCAGEMMDWRAVPDYAFADFWSHKPGWCRWFYRLLSYAITPLSVCVFNHARTIPVWRDGRILTTFRKSVQKLEEGAKVVVFPECAERFNTIVNQFQEGFVDIAKLYYKRTKQALSFVPVYIAPALRKFIIGYPISFCPDAPKEAERRRICDALMQAITELAAAQPFHTVIPYNNVPKREYPTNVLQEVSEAN